MARIVTSFSLPRALVVVFPRTNPWLHSTPGSVDSPAVAGFAPRRFHGQRVGTGADELFRLCQVPYRPRIPA